MARIQLQQRIDKDMLSIINHIKMSAMKNNKRVPTTREITRKMARMLIKEGILINDFINLKK